MVLAKAKELNIRCGENRSNTGFYSTGFYKGEPECLFCEFFANHTFEVFAMQSVVQSHMI